jgi:hypothetical protein
VAASMDPVPPAILYRCEGHPLTHKVTPAHPATTGFPDDSAAPVVSSEMNRENDGK